MRGRSKKILVVDDDLDFSESLSSVLRESGYEVTSAGDGGEALRRLRSEPLPSLILLDLMMPGTNGWQFRREQLKSAELSRIPVVVLSADGDADVEAMALGAIGCLKKPFRLDALLASIERYC